VTHALITGGAGAIGLHLARRLVDDGARVTLIDNFARARRDDDLDTLVASDRVVMVDADLAAKDLADHLGDGFTHVFHFAALLGVANVERHPQAVLSVNVELTAAALEIARRQKALARFVFASTSEVYAGTLEHFGLTMPTPESTPLALPDLARPRTSYMLSKLYGEAMCLHAGLPVTIVRPHNVYGPRMGRAHVIPQMLERAFFAADGDAFDVYSAEHTRTFCYVADAVEMIARLSNAPEAVGRAVNVGTEAPEIRMDALAEVVLATVGRRARAVPLPATAGSPARRAPDMTLCRTLTGYASQVSLEDGVARAFRWYRPRFEAGEAGEA